MRNRWRDAAQARLSRYPIYAYVQQWTSPAEMMMIQCFPTDGKRSPKPHPLGHSVTL